MKVNRLQRMKGIYPPEVPPKGSEPHGRSPSGQTIYRRKSNPRQKVPLLNENGEQVMRGGNPLTGMPGIPIFQYVRKYKAPKDGEEPRAGVHFEWEYFTITRGKHGNNRKQEYNREEAVQEQKRKEAISRKDALLERVAQRAAEVGMDLDDAVDRLLGIHEPDAPQGAGSEIRALADVQPEESGEEYDEAEALWPEDEVEVAVEAEAEDT